MATGQTRELTLVDSNVTRATLFSDAAHVTRRAQLVLPAGTTRIGVRNLPAQLDPTHLRVFASLGTVRAIETDEMTVEQTATSDAVALDRSIEALQAKARRIAGERQAIQFELELIDRVVPIASSSGVSPVALRPESFLAGLDVVIARKTEAMRTATQLDLEAVALEDEIRVMRRRRFAAGNTAGSSTKQSLLIVSLESEKGGECLLDLTYEAGWATWRPYYHVRLDPEARTIECVRFADVWQETGENWPESRLRLSTAEPELGLALPNVLPWTLGSVKSYQDKLGSLYESRKVEEATTIRPAAPSSPPPPGAMAPKPSGAAYRMHQQTPLQEPMRDMAAPAKRRREAPSANIVLSRASASPKMGAGGRGGAAHGGARNDDYEDAVLEQQAAEGIFAETTAAGFGGAGYDGMAPEEDLDEPAPTESLPRDGGGRRRPHYAPSNDHPDLMRLMSTPLPKDESGGIDYEFDVGAQLTYTSGKEHRRIGFGSVSYAAKIEYLLRPAVRDHAFGRVSVVNQDGAPLVGGPASIFVGEVFFGETRVRTTPAGGKFELDLGAETAIKSARRTKTTVRTEGILTKEDVHVVEVKIEIENFLDRTVELEVLDQVPVTMDSKIKVRLIKSTPKNAPLDDLTGILKFNVKLAPSSRIDIEFTYEIEAPKDYEFRQRLKERT